MKNEYQISLTKEPTWKKLSRSAFESEAEFEAAQKQAEGKIFFDVAIRDNHNQVRRLHSPEVKEEAWEFGLRLIMDAIRACILAHEGVLNTKLIDATTTIRQTSVS